MRGMWERFLGVLHRSGILEWECIWCWGHGTGCMKGTFGGCPVEDRFGAPGPHYVEGPK